MSANNSHNFIIKEIEFIKLIISSNIPFLGICLGAQFLAKYLGSTIFQNQRKLSEIGFYEIYPSDQSYDMFKKNNFFYQFYTKGFNIPQNCTPLAFGDKFKYQAFKYKKCYVFQFHPEVNFRMHIRWLFLILLKNPMIFLKNGAQNIFIKFFFDFNKINQCPHG